jgi:hypothetical protein
MRDEVVDRTLSTELYKVSGDLATRTTEWGVVIGSPFQLSEFGFHQIDF